MRLPDSRRLRAAFDLVRNNAGGGIRVLCYHTVIPDWVDRRVQWPVAVTLGAFERHLRHLKDQADVVSIEDLPALLRQSRKTRDRAVAVTFDDGYRSNAELVWPLMKSIGLPLAVFVSTGFLDAPRWMPTFLVRCAVHHFHPARLALPAAGRAYRLETDAEREAAEQDLARLIRNSNQPRLEALLADLRAAFPSDQWAAGFARFPSDQLMSWAEVERLHREGVVIGAHTHNHVMVSQCATDAERAEELAQPLALLRNHGIAGRHLAYTNGKRADIGDAALRYARDCGYASAFTTIPGRINNWRRPFYLPRISGQVESLEAFIRNFNRTWLDILRDEWRG
jgi:peptidoglycan/xylan/chitin deacetylase (PgdA/CDA1 family)